MGKQSEASGKIPVMPFSCIVGQEDMKLALKLVYIAPSLGGALISGQRGTGKSSAVRAFTYMMYEKLPVTIPINVTPDRVVGGWNVKELMGGNSVWREGLLEEANKSLLYIDEINLLDDYIINIILDVVSTNTLVIQRDDRATNEKIDGFTLIGTMNPEEGFLRPQLLDRFGLRVNIKEEEEQGRRLEILKSVLDYDRVRFEGKSSDYSKNYFSKAKEEDDKLKTALESAKQNFYDVDFTDDIAEKCVLLTSKLGTEGNRGDYIFALAARAYAALLGDKKVVGKHLRRLAKISLQHRLPRDLEENEMAWNQKQVDIVNEVLPVVEDPVKKDSSSISSTSQLETDDVSETKSPFQW